MPKPCAPWLKPRLLLTGKLRKRLLKPRRWAPQTHGSRDRHATPMLRRSSQERAHGTRRTLLLLRRPPARNKRPPHTLVSCMCVSVLHCQPVRHVVFLVLAICVSPAAICDHLLYCIVPLTAVLLQTVALFFLTAAPHEYMGAGETKEEVDPNAGRTLPKPYAPKMVATAQSTGAASKGFTSTVMEISRKNELQVDQYNAHSVPLCSVVPMSTSTYGCC